MKNQIKYIIIIKNLIKCKSVKSLGFGQLQKYFFYLKIIFWWKVWSHDFNRGSATYGKPFIIIIIIIIYNIY